MGAPQLHFDMFPNEGFVTLAFQGRFEVELSRQVQAMSGEIVGNPARHVLLNFEHVTEINGAGIRSLMFLAQKVKGSKKQLRIVGANLHIRQVLASEGVDQILKNCANINAALEEFGMQKKSVDVAFVNPFLVATMKVLETQASTKAQSGQVYKKQSGEKYTGDISGVIGLVSKTFTGSVVISFPKGTFLAIMTRMLGEPVTEINDMTRDGAGELTNIIFGQAKIILNERGYGINTALPSVVSGEDHQIMPMSQGPRVVIPFITDIGPFFVEICVSA